MFDRDRFVADWRDALATPHAEVAIRDLVARAVAAPSEIEAALGRPNRGGLFTLHHSPDLTILNVIWVPGMAIYPHEHGMWTVIGLYGGREDNTTGAIHVYGGDFFGASRSEWTPDGREERPFDLERARRVYAEANARWGQERHGAAPGR
jgi:predicted metal-dependent enzyme (double-stranded beta helix superfamily)